MMRSSMLRVLLLSWLFCGIRAVPGEAMTFTVTTTADTGVGSFRQALLDANAFVGPDTIVFDVPATDAGFSAGIGVWSIRPTSELPYLADEGTIIDGTTQTTRQGDLNPFGPEIEIDGTNLSNVNGFTIYAANCVIRGLIINRMPFVAIELRDPLARNNTIIGNYIGTDATGLIARGNVYGGVWIRSGANNNRVGGPSPAERNLISGTTTSVNLSTGNGVYIANADSNRILGNYIGVNREGTATLPNASIGICMRESKFNLIGGTAPGEGNVISGNGWAGMVLRIPTGRDNTISGNFIGTDPTGQIGLGNQSYGIRFDFGAQGNVVGPGNTISFNGVHGIVVSHDSTFSITISRNAISRNGGLGIANTEGGNAGVTAPVMTAATATMVTGTAQPNSIVEIFSDSSDEGALYEGTVTADPSGNFTWNGTATGPNVTATCTDAAGNTSAFSAPLIVTGVENDEGPGVPAEFALSQNFPNPFNPRTTIRYAIGSGGAGAGEGQKRGGSSWVRLSVYDLIGREVAVLVEGLQAPGQYQVMFDAAGLASGVYFARLEARPPDGPGVRDSGKSGSPFTATTNLVLLR